MSRRASTTSDPISRPEASRWIAVGLGLFVLAVPLLMPLIFPQSMQHVSPAAPPSLSANAPELEVTPREDLQRLRSRRGADHRRLRLGRSGPRGRPDSRGARDGAPAAEGPAGMALAMTVVSRSNRNNDRDNRASDVARVDSVLACRRFAP